MFTNLSWKDRYYSRPRVLPNRNGGYCRVIAALFNISFSPNFLREGRFISVGHIEGEFYIHSTQMLERARKSKPQSIFRAASQESSNVSRLEGHVAWPHERKCRKRGQNAILLNSKTRGVGEWLLRLALFGTKTEPVFFPAKAGLFTSDCEIVYF